MQSINGENELARVQRQLDELREEYARVIVEKDFLERAMEDLNFHENAHDGVVYTNADNQVIYANPYFLSMMGIRSEQELINQPFPNYMWRDADDANRLLQDIVNDGFVRERELSLYDRDGKPVFAMCSGVVSRDEDGKVLGTELMFCDITGKRAVEAELVTQHALLDAILRSTPHPVLVVNPALEVEHSNPRAQKIFKGIENGEQTNLVNLISSLGVESAVIENLVEKFKGQKRFQIDLGLNEIHYELHAAQLEAANGGWVCALHDVTLRTKTQEQLEYYAYHDMLTGLPNRAHFISRLERIVARAQHDHDYRFAILFIDMDDLKTVNDGYGHLAGDQLLREFASRLELCIRPDDMVCRLGGDEFAIFLDDISSEQVAQIVVKRINNALIQPFKLLDKHSILVSASIGSSVSSGNQIDVDQMLNEADKGMYRAKEVGK